MNSKERLRRAIFIRDKGRCVYCGRKVLLRCLLTNRANSHVLHYSMLYTLFLLRNEIRVMATGTMDHVIPRSEGGLYTAENLVLSCGTCNAQRHSTSPVATLEHVIELARSGYVCDCGNLKKHQNKPCKHCRRKTKYDDRRCKCCSSTARRNSTMCRRCSKTMRKDHFVGAYI